jgi:ELWxxDGT repeat protein
MNAQLFSYRIGAAVVSATLAVSGFAAPAAAGDAPRLVADINIQQASSEPTAFVDVADTAFFFACDGSHQLTLYTSDGTGPGTAPIKPVGQCETETVESVADVAVGGKLFFTQPYVWPHALWVSDGTPGGTVILNADLPYFDQMAAVGGTLFFSTGRDLWTSDGTPEGTVAIRRIDATDLVSFGGKLYFTSGGDLWSSVGTGPGTVRVKDINPSGRSWVAGLRVVGSRLFFTAHDKTSGPLLWISNGTAAGTHQVKQIDPSGKDAVHSLVAVGNGLFFVARDAAHGVELWRSNGTAAGTKRVLDINPAGNSDPQALIAAGDRLYFTATDGAHDRRLWTSDGTTIGTKPVKNIIPRHQAALGSELFFDAIASGGDELWKSDGTTAGTVRVADINASGDSEPYDLAVAAGRLFFSADDGITGRELWTSDGSAAGTSIVADLNTSTLGSGSTPLATIGGNVLFAANDGIHGYQLWKTDGTALGTARLGHVSLADPTDLGSSFPLSIAVLNGVLYFSGYDSVHGLEPWRSDGTPEGTAILKDVTAGSGDSFQMDLTSAGGKLYFTTRDSSNTHVKLWTSDGTTAGTKSIKSFGSGRLQGLTAVGSQVFFLDVANAPDCAIDCAHPFLWKSDGTAAGTVRVSSHEFFADDLVGVGSTLYFSTGNQLWKSDGTSAGTLRLLKIFRLGDESIGSLTNVAGRVYFTASRYDRTLDMSVSQLWTSDGTSGGTAVLHEFTSREPRELTAMNGSLYFEADDQTDVYGPYELWKSDGTVPGTAHVSDTIFGGNPDGSPTSSLRNVGGTLYFAATTAASVDVELWKSDGSDAGTQLVADLDPHGSSMPSGFIKLGTHLILSADDGSHGSELWEMPLQ